MRRGPHGDHPLRVVFISHTPYPGGAERSLLELVTALKVHTDLDVQVVFPHVGPLMATCEDLGVPAGVIDYDWWSSVPGHVNKRHRWIRNLASVARFVRHFRRVRPDVVVTNTISPLSAALASRILSVPHVWYIHEFGREDHDMSFDLGLAATCRSVGLLSRRVVANSFAVQRALARWISPGKLRVVYYAVGEDSPPSPPEPPADRFVAVMVGELKQSKGQADALRAIGRLRERGCPVSLHLVGGGHDERVDELRRLADHLHLTDVVHFTGFVDDPSSSYLEANVALMSSRAEAFGRVTVEAMKKGRPVIGARSGATPELIRDGCNGLLYRHGDVDDLASKLESLYRDPGLARRMGTMGFEWATATFTPARYAAGFERVLREVTRPGRTETTR